MIYDNIIQTLHSIVGHLDNYLYQQGLAARDLVIGHHLHITLMSASIRGLPEKSVSKCQSKTNAHKSIFTVNVLINHAVL